MSILILILILILSIKYWFSGLEGLLNHHIDILVTPDEVRNNNIVYEILTVYELVLLVSSQHPLAKRKNISPDCLSNETLLTFPDTIDRLDIITQFLNPAYVRPAKLKKIESTELMLQMVALGRGVCALPEWLAVSGSKEMAINKIRIGTKGIHKKLYAALRTNDREVTYIKNFVNVGKKTANIYKTARC